MPLRRHFSQFKAFNPHAFLGTAGRTSALELDENHNYVDEKVLQKFYKAFPQLKVTPNVFKFYNKRGSDHMFEATPVFDFVQKYKKLRAKGYSEYKAFSVVEQELRAVLENQLDEARILRGAAMAVHGDSYLDRAQRVAQLESEMKLMRFMRDMPKHERKNAQFLSMLESEVRDTTTLEGEEDVQGDSEVRQDSLEDLFS